MQDDNELHAQSILTVAAFKEWAKSTAMSIPKQYKLADMSVEVLNYTVGLYLFVNGFSPDTKLIDGTYVEYLVIKE